MYVLVESREGRVFMINGPYPSRSAAEDAERDALAIPHMAKLSTFEVQHVYAP